MKNSTLAATAIFSISLIGFLVYSRSSSMLNLQSRPHAAAASTARESSRASAGILAAAPVATDDPALPPTMVGQVVRTTTAGEETAEPASDRRILLSPNERVVIRLNAAEVNHSAPVVLRADNGGLINGRPLSPQVTLKSPELSFAFQAGADRGLYSVSVQQAGHDTETIEFWVGIESPRGAPGPVRQFPAPRQG